MVINPYSQNQLVGNHPSQPVISGDLLLGVSPSSSDVSLCQPRLFLCGQIRGGTLGVLGQQAICHPGTEGAHTQTKPRRKCGLSLGHWDPHWQSQIWLNFTCGLWGASLLWVHSPRHMWCLENGIPPAWNVQEGIPPFPSIPPHPSVISRIDTFPVTLGSSAGSVLFFSQQRSLVDWWQEHSSSCWQSYGVVPLSEGLWIRITLLRRRRQLYTLDDGKRHYPVNWRLEVRSSARTHLDGDGLPTSPNWRALWLAQVSSFECWDEVDVIYIPAYTCCIQTCHLGKLYRIHRGLQKEHLFWTAPCHSSDVGLIGKCNQHLGASECSQGLGSQVSLLLGVRQLRLWLWFDEHCGETLFSDPRHSKAKGAFGKPGLPHGEGQERGRPGLEEAVRNVWWVIRRDETMQDSAALSFTWNVSKLFMDSCWFLLHPWGAELSVFAPSAISDPCRACYFDFLFEPSQWSHNTLTPLPRVLSW